MAVLVVGTRDTRSLESDYVAAPIRAAGCKATRTRTSEDECRRISAFLSADLKVIAVPVELLIPQQGVSALDVPGQPLQEPAADLALFPAASNDPEFVVATPAASDDVVEVS